MGLNRTTYFGNSSLGMFLKANDDISFLPQDSLDKLLVAAEQYLKTKTVRFSVGESNLLGLYTAINSNGIILPNITEEKELAILKSELRDSMNIYISKDNHNAHGNNMSVNDNGGIINPNVGSEERKKMEEALDIELIPMSIAGYTTLGSCCITTKEGFFAHYETSDEEMEKIEEILKVKGKKGTVSNGSGFVAYGVVANKNGYLAGENTTAFELGRMEEALGLIK